jgi:hypothetical protein
VDYSSSPYAIYKPSHSLCPYVQGILMTDSFYSKEALSLMATQCIEAKAQGDPRYFMLLMTLSQITQSPPEHVEHYIKELILPNETKDNTP